MRPLPSRYRGGHKQTEARSLHEPGVSKKIWKGHRLVVEPPTPLKNDGGSESQLGSWHSQLNGKRIQKFQTTNQSFMVTLVNRKDDIPYMKWKNRSPLLNHQPAMVFLGKYLHGEALWQCWPCKFTAINVEFLEFLIWNVCGRDICIWGNLNVYILAISNLISNGGYLMVANIMDECIYIYIRISNGCYKDVCRKCQYWLFIANEHVLCPILMEHTNHGLFTWM